MSRKRKHEEEEIQKKIKKYEERLRYLREPSLSSDSDSEPEMEVETIDPNGPWNEEDIKNETNSLADEVIIVSETPATDKMDPEIMQILGEDTCDTKFGNNFHPELASRLDSIIKKGLSNEIQKQMLEKYLPPANCGVIAPILNREVAAAIPFSLEQRDKKIKDKQSLICASISALGNMATDLITEGKDTQHLKITLDACKSLCHVLFYDSLTRRKILLPSLSKSVLAVVKDLPVTTHLFGDSLSENIRTAKAVERSVRDIKANTKITKNRKPPGRSNKQQQPKNMRPYYQHHRGNSRGTSAPYQKTQRQQQFQQNQQR